MSRSSRATVDLVNLVPNRSTLDRVIVWAIFLVAGAMWVFGVASGGDSRAWALGGAAFTLLIVLSLTRRQRIEWDGDVPVIVNRAVCGWERRFVLGPDARAVTCSTMGRTWVGAHGGRRRVWVQVLSLRSDLQHTSGHAARPADEREAPADALSVCANGPDVAARLRQHVVVTASGVAIDDSPLWRAEDPRRSGLGGRRGNP